MSTANQSHCNYCPSCGALVDRRSSQDRRKIAIGNYVGPERRGSSGRGRRAEDRSKTRWREYKRYLKRALFALALKKRKECKEAKEKYTYEYTDYIRRRDIEAKKKVITEYEDRQRLANNVALTYGFSLSEPVANRYILWHYRATKSKQDRVYRDVGGKQRRISAVPQRFVTNHQPRFIANPALA